MEQYSRRVQRRAEADDQARQDDDLAGRAALPEGARRQRRCAQGGGRHAPTPRGWPRSTDLIGKLTTATSALETAADHHADGVLAEAKHLRDAVLPAMLKVRDVADTLEGLVADDLWPLPSYQEMLFIK